VPRRWEGALADLAEHYGWAPSELWALGADGWELKFWIEQINKRHGR
jgi:hypothetical protein